MNNITSFRDYSDTEHLAWEHLWEYRDISEELGFLLQQKMKSARFRNELHDAFYSKDNAEIGRLLRPLIGDSIYCTAENTWHGGGHFNAYISEKDFEDQLRNPK